MKYLRYIIIGLIVIIPSVITVLIYNDKITQNSPVYYKQGVEFYDKGDYSNAYYNFSKIKPISPLYPMALYKQAKSAQKHEDYATAVFKYELFLKKNPISVFAFPARFNLAKCYYSLKKYSEAKEQFLILKENKIDTFGVEDYYLGLIFKQEKNHEEAYKYLKNYILGVLSDGISDKNFIISAAKEIESLALNLTEEDLKILGQVYYTNRKYNKALVYFSKLPISKYWDYLVVGNHYAGNKVVAKKLIEDGLNQYSYNADNERLHKIYDIYASYMQGSKIKNWTQMRRMVQDNSLKGEDYVIYKLAQILPREKSIELYSEIMQKYPMSDYAPESLWNVFFNKYLNKEYSQAELLAYKHLKEYPNANSTPRMLFWLYKTLVKLNKNSDAHNVLSKLVLKYPDDYYGLRAEYILNKKQDFWTAMVGTSISQNESGIEFPMSLANLDIKDIKLINTIFSLGDYEIWADADLGNKIVESWFEKKRGKKSLSIVLARDMISEMDIKPSFYSSAYKLAYPLYWVEEINIASKKFVLNPWIVMALVREESYFNENALSSTNAVGLTQLMPGTANFLLSKFSMDTSIAQQLNNPRINLYLGCLYLHYLKERFNNNDLYTIAAYNGGEGSVNKWIRNYNSSDNDEFIERIPFEETRTYVKKIFRSYHMYKKIYE